jgi:hypothetical protein
MGETKSFYDKSEEEWKQIAFGIVVGLIGVGVAISFLGTYMGWW